MGKNVRIATFTVTMEIDPEAYGSEYGEVVTRETPWLAALHAQEMIMAHLEPFTLAGVTMPGFKDNHGHWAEVSFSSPEVVPVHRDALEPGQRNPYVNGEFVAKCVCGAEFRSAVEPFAADSLMMDHCEEENAK